MLNACSNTRIYVLVQLSLHLTSIPTKVLYIHKCTLKQ